jgi:hypothetical protein
MSTSLKASTSANSMNTGSKFLDGLGVKLVMGGMIPKVTGFGNRPLPPHRCLPRHITDFPFSRLYAFRALSMLIGSLSLREPTLTLASLLF